MKSIDLNKLQPDPIAAALASSDKEVVTVSGYICAINERTISMSETRDGTSYVEYPRSAIIAAFTEGELGKEESGRVTLIVDANARIRIISSSKVETLQTQARSIGETGGACCSSADGSAKCCCKEGERCKSLTHTCFCESASRPFSPTDVGFIASSQKANTSVTNPFSPTSLLTLPPGYCSTARGICPWVCYPIIVDGKIVDWDCYCDCSRPIPPPNRQF